MAATTDPLIRNILRDDSITRGLEDEEARMLIEWIVDWAELLADAARNEEEAQTLVTRLCRRAKAIGRFVHLWADVRTRGSAVQLAAVEQFSWPLPTDNIEPADLMHHILAWENQHSES